MAKKAEDEVIHLPAISIREPFAGWIFHTDDSKRKWCENRTWSTSYRGLIAIHRASFGGQQSAIIGVADLVDVQEIGDSPGRHREKFIRDAVRKYGVNEDAAAHVEGPFAFVLVDARRFTRPLPIRGRLGFFSVRIDLRNGTAEHLGRAAGDRQHAAPTIRRTVRRRPRRTLTNEQILGMSAADLDRVLFGEDRAS